MLGAFIRLFKLNANWRTLILAIGGIIYLVLGAIFFKLVESDKETIMNRKRCAEEMELRKKYNISKEDFDNLTIIIMELEPHRSGEQWGFSGSIYFAITVVTTIGYGHSVPQTDVGKILCIFYATFGIPLWLITFQAIGERINTGAKYLFKVVGHKMGYKFEQISHKCLIPFGILTCVMTLVLGTMSFAHFENWSYLNSAYYCVMTLTTIGFGDFVALQKGKSLTAWPQYVSFTLIYIMIGLAVIGAFLNLVVLRLMVTLPATPEHSISGGSKKNSTQQSPTLSIRSRFEDVDSADELNGSSRSLDGCREKQDCSLRQEELPQKLRYDRLQEGASEKKCKTDSIKTFDYCITDVSAIKSKCESDICPSCRHHIRSLCEKCHSKLFQCFNCCTNCCLCSELDSKVIISNETNKCEDEEAGPSSSFDAHASFCSTSCGSELSRACYHPKEEELTSSFRSNYPDASAPEASLFSKPCIPEVTVSHIKVTISEQSFEDNRTTANNHDYSDSACTTSNFLSPADCHLRRARFGSGDSGYLGGAQSSSGNVSNHIDDVSSDSEKSSESKRNFEIKTRPVSLPSKFDTLEMSQTFCNRSFKGSYSDLSSRYDMKKTSSTIPRSLAVISAKSKSHASCNSVIRRDKFKRKSFVNLQGVGKNRMLLRKNELRREASISCQSDTDVVYSRSDELLTRDNDVVERICESKFLPLAIEQEKHTSKAKSSSLRSLYKRVSSKQKRRKEFSKSLSQQDSTETSVSIINSGDWDDQSLAKSSVQKHLLLSQSESIEKLLPQKNNFAVTPEDSSKDSANQLSNGSFVRCQNSALLNTQSLTHVAKKRSYSDSALHDKACVNVGRCWNCFSFQSTDCCFHAFRHKHFCPHLSSHCCVFRPCFHHCCKRHAHLITKKCLSNSENVPRQCWKPGSHEKFRSTFQTSSLREHRNQETSNHNRSTSFSSLQVVKSLFDQDNQGSRNSSDDAFSDQTSLKYSSDNNVFCANNLLAVNSPSYE